MRQGTARSPRAAMFIGSRLHTLPSTVGSLAVAQATIAVVLLAGCIRPSEPEPSSADLDLDAAAPAIYARETSQQSWPGWRGGPAGGVAQSERSLQVHWNATSGIRWKTAIPGQGNSSPMVWGQRVVLTTGTSVEGHVRLDVVCIDRATGRRLWTNETAVASGPTHRKNGFSSATPATDGQRIYVSFGSAGLFCLDLDGRRVWHAPQSARPHEWGAAASPVVFGGMVIQVCDQQDDSMIAAFDAATGAPRWRTVRQNGGGWSTPVIVEAFHAGGVRHELIVNGSGASRGGGWVIAYDPATGRELWRVRGTTDVVCPTPVVASGLVVSSSGRNGPIFAIRTGGSGDVTSSHVAWRHGRGGAYVPSGVSLNNRLYLIRDEGSLDCYEVLSGKRLWQQRLPGSFTASLVAGDGKVYATSEQGRVYVVAEDERFNLLATNRLDERCLATPAIAGSELFIRTESQLYCIATPPSELATASDNVLPPPSDTSSKQPSTSRVTAASSKSPIPPIHASPSPSKKKQVSR